MEVLRKLVARCADLIAVRRGKHRRRNRSGAVILQPRQRDRAFVARRSACRSPRPPDTSHRRRSSCPQPFFLVRLPVASCEFSTITDPASKRHARKQIARDAERHGRSSNGSLWLRRRQSTCAPDARITGAHFVALLLHERGALLRVYRPRLRSRSSQRTPVASLVLMAVLAASLRMAMISFGVPFGASSTPQVLDLEAGQSLLVQRRHIAAPPPSASKPRRRAAFTCPDFDERHDRRGRPRRRTARDPAIKSVIIGAAPL